VRPFGHQHHSRESKVGSFGYEFIDGKESLPPETGVAHRMQQQSIHRI
jgi:hypothetical protein